MPHKSNNVLTRGGTSFLDLKTEGVLVQYSIVSAQVKSNFHLWVGQGPTDSPSTLKGNFGGTDKEKPIFPRLDSGRLSE